MKKLGKWLLVTFTETITRVLNHRLSLPHLQLSATSIVLPPFPIEAVRFCFGVLGSGRSNSHSQRVSTDRAQTKTNTQPSESALPLIRLTYLEHYFPTNIPRFPSLQNTQIWYQGSLEGFTEKSKCFFLRIPMTHESLLAVFL